MAVKGLTSVPRSSWKTSSAAVKVAVELTIMIQDIKEEGQIPIKYIEEFISLITQLQDFNDWKLKVFQLIYKKETIKYFYWLSTHNQPPWTARQDRGWNMQF